MTLAVYSFTDSADKIYKNDTDAGPEVNDKPVSTEMVTMYEDGKTEV